MPAAILDPARPRTIRKDPPERAEALHQLPGPLGHGALCVKTACGGSVWNTPLMSPKFKLNSFWPTLIVGTLASLLGSALWYVSGLFILQQKAVISVRDFWISTTIPVGCVALGLASVYLVYRNFTHLDELETSGLVFVNVSKTGSHNIERQPEIRQDVALAAMEPPFEFPEFESFLRIYWKEHESEIVSELKKFGIDPARMNVGVFYPASTVPDPSTLTPLRTPMRLDPIKVSSAARSL